MFILLNFLIKPKSKGKNRTKLETDINKKHTSNNTNKIHKNQSPETKKRATINL